MRLRAVGASGRVDRAVEFAVEHRLVDFLQLPLGGFVFDADDDAIGMQEILDCGAFAQKLGIGSDAKRDAAFAAVDGKRALEFFSRPRGDRAFFDDELGRTGFAGDGSRDVVDGAEVGVAIGQRRRANADENGVAAGRVGGIAGRNSAGRPCALCRSRCRAQARKSGRRPIRGRESSPRHCPCRPLRGRFPPGSFR